MIRSQKVNPKNTDFKVGKYRDVKVIETNTQIQTKVSSYRANGCSIERIDADHYKVKSTGKIKEIQHGQKRVDNLSSIAQSLKRLRDIINTNVSADNVDNIRWVTLTYEENMTDANRLYTDFKKFMQRLRYWCEKQGFGRPEYIGAVEPQQRGAYHWHILLIWQEPAPFIPNNVLKGIWKKLGFVSIKALDKNCSNIGLYLSAYLGDLEFDEAITLEANLNNYSIKHTNGKRYVKGSRLHLYPKGFKLYRLSKGIKRPKEYTMPYNELMEMLDKEDAELSYESLVYLYDDSHYFGFNTLVQNRYYDITAPAKQRARMYKAHCISKYYRTLFEEMVAISSERSEYQEYRKENNLDELFEEAYRE